MTLNAILDELLGGRTAYPAAPDECDLACDAGSTSAGRSMMRALGRVTVTSLSLYSIVGPQAQTDGVWRLARSNRGGPK